MAQYLPLPDGSSVTIREGETPQDAWARAQRMYPEAFRTEAPPEKKQSGILASGAKGLESLISSGRTAVGSIVGDPNEAARAALARGEDMDRRYADDVSLDRVKKAYAERGLLPAAGEVVSQIPKAIAEQAPNIAATLGSAKLGAMAGSAVGPVGTVVGGIGGALLPNLVQMFGSNVERQAVEQDKAGQPIDINRGAAAAAALPQAALDTAATFIPFGGRFVSKVTGIPTEALLGKSAAQMGKLAEERLLTTLAKGTGVGAISQIPTEVAQQMLERAQAGLSLTSPDALAEYGETAYQAGLLGPIGAVGRLSERAGAREKVAADAAEEKRKAREAELAAQQAEEARKQTPEYAMEAAKTYAGLEQQVADLRGQLRKIEKDSPTATADREFNKSIQAQLTELGPQLKAAAQEFNRVQPILQPLIEQDKAARIQAELAQMRQQMDQTPGTQATIPGLEPMETEAPPAAPDLQAQRQVLEQQLATSRRLLQEAIPIGNPEQIAQREQGVVSAQFALDNLDRQMAEAPPTTSMPPMDPRIVGDYIDGEIEKLRTQAQQATDLGEIEEINTKVVELQQKRADLVGPQEKLAALAKQMQAAKASGDTAKQAKIAAKLRDLGVTDLRELAEQQRFPLFDQTPISESKADFAARVYEPGAADIESQELAAREDAQQAEQDALAETERERRIAPEVAALRRIAGRDNPGSVASYERMAELIQAQKPPAGGSTPMAQAAQRLPIEAEAAAAREKLAQLDNQLFSITEQLKQPMPRREALALRNRLDELTAARAQAEAASIAAQQKYERAREDQRQGELIPTAEEETPPPQPRRVPGTGELRLYNERGERPLDRAELENRLGRLLLDDRLSADARALLQRIERVLPQGNYARTEERVATRKLGKSDAEVAAERAAALEADETYVDARPQVTVKDTARTEGFLTLVDRQLTKIERGLEGVAQRGKPRTIELQRFPTQPTQASTTPPTVGLKTDIESRASATPTSKSPLKIAVPQPAQDTRTDTASGEVPATKRRVDNQKTTLRGPSTEAVDLTDTAEIEPLLRDLERAAESDLEAENAQRKLKGLKPLEGIPGEQMSLPLVEQEGPGGMNKEWAGKPTAAKLGTIKSDAASFQRLLNSPHVRKLRKELTAPFEKMARANRELPKLQADIDALKDKLAKMFAAQAEYKNAEQVLKATRDIETAQRSLETLNRRMTSLVVDRMQLRGDIDTVRTERDKATARVQELQGVEPGLLAEANLVEQARAAEADLDALDDQLQQLQTDQTATQTALEVLQAQLQAARARTEIASLRERAPFPVEVEQTKQELQAKQDEATKIDREARGAFSEDQRAKRDAERRAQAEDRSAQEAARTEARKERDRLQAAMYGDSSSGLQYPAITEAQRVAREMGPPVLTPAEIAQQNKDPVQVLGGYRAQQRTIEKRLQNSQESARQARAKQLDGLRNARDKAYAAYKAAKSATERDVLGDKYDAAERTLTNAERKLSVEPLTWVGMKRDIAQLSDVLNKIDDLEYKLNNGLVETTLAPPRTVQKRDSAGERFAKEERQRKAEAAEAAKRADAPSTSGDAVTRSDVKKLTKGQKTQYSSKGNTEEAQKQREDIARERTAEAVVAASDPEQRQSRADLQAALRIKQARGEKLNPFEQAILSYNLDGPLFQMAATASQGPKVEVDAEDNAAVVMDGIAKDSTNALNRAVAQRLKLLLGSTEVKLVKNLTDDNGNPVYGSAKVDGTSISLDLAHGLNEQTVLHEGVHAAVERALRMPEDKLTDDQRAAKRELEALYKAFVADKSAPNENAKTNVSEFVSEALSDNVLQDYLKSKKWTLKNMWNGVKNGILRMIGVDVPANMRDATLAAADRLMMRVVRPTPADATLAVPSLNRPVDPRLSQAMSVANDLVTKQRPWAQQVFAENTGLTFSTRYVDRFAAPEFLSKFMEGSRGDQMMYFLRQYDYRMNVVAESANNGAFELRAISRKDGGTEYLVESKDGASLRSTVEILRGAKPIVGNVDAVNELFTTYLAAKRVERVGIAALDFGGKITEARLKDAVKQIEAIPELRKIFERARDEYNAYNEGLVRFVQQSGAISKATADKLLASKDYIPFYRKSKDGSVDLVLGGESPIRIGNLRDQPHLHELVGGDEPIFDFFKSSMQNTNMLVDMALGNLARRSLAMELVNLKAATFTPSQISGRDVFKFRLDGKDMYARVDTDTFGVDAETLVKGLEGIPTQLTGIMRMASLPARLLRRAVLANPLYPARQLFRDQLAASVLSGADFAPVISAFKEVGSAASKTLNRRGVTGGQYFTGTQEDMSRIMRDIADGKPGWAKMLGRLEAFGMEADALTRRAQYNSYIKQGLSEMEATLATMDSTNFTKRGASPSIHMANSLIPFFSAQIQGLNTLYRAITGKASQAEKLRLQSKLLARGAMLFGMSLAYAAAMQDDEAYQNATPDQKYGNWFIRVPGLDEPLKLPVPFEVGYIFKAVPEALYNAIVNGEQGQKEAKEAMLGIMRNVIPGGTSYGIPQAMKPAIEVGLGKSFYTGRDILSTREQNVMPEYQFRENTSELAKMFGSATGISPIKFEALVNGYTGTLGLALLQVGNAGFSSKDSPEKAVKRLSEMPIVGGAFQPNDAGYIINSVYDRLKEAEKVKASVNDLLKKGERARAMALMQERSDEYALASVGDWFQTTMTKLTQYETAIRASDRSPEDKRKLLDEARRMKISLAASVREQVGKTTPQ